MDAGDEEVVAGAGAGDVQEVAFEFVGFLEITGVADGVEARGRRDNVVIAGHDDHGPILEPLGEVHGREVQRAGQRGEALIQDDRRQARRE